LILTGDIGGTKTLLALHDDSGAIAVSRRYPSRDAATFDELVARFLDETAARPRLACFGIAGPVLGGHVRVTHLPWEIDAAQVAARFGLQRVLLLNDFAAAAHGIGALTADDLATLQAGEPAADRPRLVIGAGTGLGIAYVQGDRVLSGEGGHAGFAPADAIQAALWQWLHRRLGRVEVEHVVSGGGLALVYEFLLEQAGGSVAPGARDALAAEDAAAAIGRRALEQGDPPALAALDLFIACYGALAGDQALTVLARGGVFVTGGIAPKLLPRLAAGGFLAAFNDKGSFAPLARACPVHVVTNPDLPLLGAARHAAKTLTTV
jgi:glucokinase